MSNPNPLEQIAARAYELWEEEGYPKGRERIHWRKAEREFNAESDFKAPVRGAKTRFRSAKNLVLAT